MELSTFYDLLSIIGVLFLLLITGYICRRVGFIDDLGSKRLSKLIISIGQPMMIVGALISKDFSWELLKTGMFYMLIGFLLHPLMALLAWLVSPMFPKGSRRNISMFSIIFTNCGFIGLPILNTIFPGQGAFLGAFFLIGFHVYIWTLGIYILSRGSDNVKLTPKKAIFNYGTVPCAIGLVLYLAKAYISIPGFVVNFTNQLGNLCLPISLLIIGALIAAQGFKPIFTNGRLYLFNLAKLLIVPLAVCGAVKLATLGMADAENARNIVLFCTMIAAMPSATTVAMLSEIYDLDSKYAAQAVGSTSLISVATLPLLYFIGDLVGRL